ncbi:hypothetical protein EUGRSUZ_G00177 [Eucalyptus grandis]|uniref:Uncharacterized protein n=2 Tax=Eucalyptus grandis TaxID=71139 RepID=A0ACC3K0X3_EUCGR|nr:hypothetical protein EUGRSUZ_G00177 [Eucalyptus grandis]
MMDSRSFSTSKFPPLVFSDHSQLALSFHGKPPYTQYIRERERERFRETAPARLASRCLGGCRPIDAFIKRN